MNITVSGLIPAFSGDDWFLLDESGAFSLDKTVMADIWLVGGGCDGRDGYKSPDGALHGGDGGDGGCVYKFGKIKLIKDTFYDIIVADANDPEGTVFTLGQAVFKCSQMGSFLHFGGTGGIVNLNGGTASPKNGINGVMTPYGYVGSSGGGGLCTANVKYNLRAPNMSVGGVGAGNSRLYFNECYDRENTEKYAFGINATNYGCGGGGNTFCYGVEDIDIKSCGKKGCVIVRYEVCQNDGENSPECSIQYWDNKASKTKAKNVALRDEIKLLEEQCEKTVLRNIELERKVEELKAEIAEAENKG